MYFLIITISSCLSHHLSHLGSFCSESCPPLRNIHCLEDLGARLAQSLLGDALLVHELDAFLDALHSFIAEGIAAQSHAEVVGGDRQSRFDVRLR